MLPFTLLSIARLDRRTYLCVTPSIRSEPGRRRFLYIAVSKYNGLPPELRSLSPAGFKRELKEYLWEKQRAD